MIQCDGCIFFRWVGEKPPTRLSWTKQHAGLCPPFLSSQGHMWRSLETSKARVSVVFVVRCFSFCWTLVPRKWGNEHLCYLCSMFLGVWFFGCHRQIWIKAFSNEKRGPGCLEYSVSHFSLETSHQIASPPNRSLLLCQSILNSVDFFAGQAHPKKKFRI